MTLVALVDPQSSTLWRASYAIIALGGALVVFVVRGAVPDALGKVAYAAAIALYLVVGTSRSCPHTSSGIPE